MKTPKLTVSQGVWLMDNQDTYKKFKGHTILSINTHPVRPGDVSARYIGHMMRRYTKTKLDNKWVRAMAIRFVRETGMCPFEFRGK